MLMYIVTLRGVHSVEHFPSLSNQRAQPRRLPRVNLKKWVPVSSGLLQVQISTNYPLYIIHCQTHSFPLTLVHIFVLHKVSPENQLADIPRADTQGLGRAAAVP